MITAILQIPVDALHFGPPLALIDAICLVLLAAGKTGLLRVTLRWGISVTHARTETRVEATELQ